MSELQFIEQVPNQILLTTTSGMYGSAAMLGAAGCPGRRSIVQEKGKFRGRSVRCAGLICFALFSGCASHTARFLEDSGRRGVLCFGDRYWVYEGVKSVNKAEDCIKACQRHGFEPLQRSTDGHTFRSVDDNLQEYIPKICQN
jgi:hypothetical protein